MTSKVEANLLRWCDVALQDPGYRVAYEAINKPSEALLLERDYAAISRRIGALAQAEIRDPVELFKAFHASIAAGIFPHPHVLAFIATRLSYYLQKCGDVTLDQAFGLESVQKAGNPAKRDATAQAQYKYCWEMFEMLRQNPKLTRENVAEKVRENLGIDQPDVERMVKIYARWKRNLMTFCAGGDQQDPPRDK